jgi:hypothetical protein
MQAVLLSSTKSNLCCGNASMAVKAAGTLLAAEPLLLAVQHPGYGAMDWMG